MKTVFLTVGGSASGKDSIVSKLTEQGYIQLISYATRPCRVNEGNTHVFIQPEEVINYQEDMVAYTQIGSAEYFATKRQLLECDLYVIDPVGIRYLKQIIKDIRFVTIYISLPEEIRFQRATSRQDKNGVIIKRFIDESQRFKEFIEKTEFDYAVTNYDLSKSVEIIKNIIEVERKYN